MSSERMRENEDWDIKVCTCVHMLGVNIGNVYAWILHT